MSVCYLDCNERLTAQIRNFPKFISEDFVEVHFPITGLSVSIDYLIIGPGIRHLARLGATISDWNIPPVTLFVLNEEDYAEQSEHLHHHPRIGRSIFFCKDDTESIQIGLEQISTYQQKRNSLPIDHSISGNYTTNNISPRWLFQTMMEHLDEYIYFKDADSRFLAVSRYLAESSGNSEPSDVLGLTDFDLFDKMHSEEAYKDEHKIATGALQELNKEEAVEKDGKTHWVASRKLPLCTRSGFLAGSFGLSRDVTEEKELHKKLEENHERMQSELVLARNLQSTLMQRGVPDFTSSTGHKSLEIATKYIPSFHLSGDFFSITKTEDGGAAILIADVMGHGVRAAMVTAMIQIAVQQLNTYASQPAEFMTRLNDMIKHTMQPAGQTIFTTAAYCYIDLQNKQLNYTQAGARHGVYVPVGASKSASVFNGKSMNPALGLIPNIKYSEASMPLETGDEVILYTDGIIEAAMGEEEYSEKRMLDFLMEHRRDALPDMINSLLGSVKDFTQSDELDDDVCLIGMRIH